MIPILIFAKPVKVDELLTKSGDVKVDLSLGYSNIDKKTDTFYPITYQTANGDFVTIPSYTGSQKSNQDYFNYGISLKYGLTQKLEIFSNINMFTSHTNISHNGDFYSQNDKGFNNLNIGLAYQLKKEDESPAFLIGASTDAISNIQFSDNSNKKHYFKNYGVFVSSYYTVDPIVFFIKADYRIDNKKEYGGRSVENGDSFILSPQVYFAVNPYTNLNWGLKYQYSSKNKVDGQVVSGNNSSLGYLMGLSYELSSKSIIDVAYENNDNSDYAIKSLNLTMTYKF